MQRLLAIILLFIAPTICLAEIVRYDGHKVIRVQASDQEQLKWLGILHDSTLLDFWTYPSLVRPTDIRVGPEEFEQLADDLVAHGFNYTIVQEDVQKLIESMGQHPHSPDKRQVNIIRENVLGGFPTYSAIYNWAQEKRSQNEDIMSLHTLGKTYQGQDQYLVKLGVKKNTAKPVVWLDSGIHAREWLSVSTTINIINKMLTQYKAKDSTVMDLLSTFDFYFIPVANPDGYVYSHTSGGRLWRKTRTRHVSGSIGVDPNRNWGYHWCVSGSSRSASSDSYCGPYAWSENCVYNMKQTLQNLGSRLKVFMTLHSYGQMWFVPYAWSRSAYPTDYNELVSLSISATSAMRKSTGASYRVGRVPDLLYEASGSSMDWVKGTLKTKYAFAMELRPSENVANGFIAPVSDIAPTAEEVWEGFKVVVEKAKGNLLAG